MSGLVSEREELRALVAAIVEDYDAGQPPFDRLRLPEHRVRDEFRGSRDDYANFLTLTAAVDYMKETAGENGLWKTMLRLYQDDPWVFQPTEIVQRGKETLADRLDGVSLLWGNQDLNIWYTVSETLAERFEGETTTFLAAQEYDALDLRAYMERHGSCFPYIKGDKINPLWLRLMHEEIHELDRIDQVDIPVDVRIIDVTNELLGTTYSDCEDDKYEIRMFWGKFCRDYGFIPVHIDQPLWLLSKNWDDPGEDYVKNLLKRV